MMSDLVDLESGRWQQYIESTAAGAVMELVQLARPYNKMRVRLPDDWRALSPSDLREIQRRPEVRLWIDDGKISWRVSAVGPGTEFPYPLRDRHLVFDSDQTWAGIVPFTGAAELGDLTDLELQRLRDRMSDFGGRRRGYRPPLRSSGPAFIL